MRENVEVYSRRNWPFLAIEMVSIMERKVEKCPEADTKRMLLGVIDSMRSMVEAGFVEKPRVPR